MSDELPQGTVTFLFTDVEGSTRLLLEQGAESYADVLAEHRRVLRDAIHRHGGVEVDTQGDAFFVAFPTAPTALRAAADAQARLAIPVRMGLHTGTPLFTAEGYVGTDVHRAARIAAAGHGGQVLVSASTAALVEDELRDLGEHRLKDLSAPERIYQLGEGTFPPLKVLYRTNLPVPATSFLGREQELADLRELLERDDVRLLTLTGPGGTGKTRLALQAAGEASEKHPDGVFWTPLAPLRDAALVLEQAAQAAGAKDGLAEFVGDRRVLLLLDNFEHVMTAAADVAALLMACPNLRVLVTSRELLQIAGEQAYPVPPLGAVQGVELFAARARLVKPAFEPDDAVPALCRRLDNLPLALELAAAHVRMLTPQQLLDRLGQRLDLLKGGRDAEVRQRTLRATIEWSHDLLDAEEKRLFARLAAFRGGFTLEAAEEICEAEIDSLQSLVDKSLVRVDEDGRFWLLETIREFAGERLEMLGDADETLQRHAEWFLALVESAPGAAESSALSANVADTGEWRKQIEAEYDNVRAALDLFEARRDVGRQLRLAFVVSWLYSWMRGGLLEAARWYESVLSRQERLTSEQRVDALQSFAHFGRQLTWERRRELAQESLDLARAIDDPGRVEWSLRRLGNVYMERDPGEGRRILIECEQLARELPERGRLAWIQQNLGFLASLEGDYEEARTRLEESVELFEELGGSWQAVNALDGLGAVALAQGRLEDARRILAECLPRAVALGAQLTVANCLGWAGGIASAEEKPALAARLIAAADTILETEGAIDDLDADVWMRHQPGLKQRLASDFEEAWEAGRNLGVEDAVALALGQADAR